MSEKINIEGREIALKQVGQEDYASLTDMARSKRPNSRPDDIIRAYLRSPGVILFLEEWEKAYGDFKPDLWVAFKSELLSPSFNPTVKQYLTQTQSRGIFSTPGRYGGTFAHIDIAFEFATWLEPRFKLFLIRDYRRLKAQEAKRLKEGWDIPRFLVKGSFALQNAAIKRTLAHQKEGKEKEFVYADEADVLNKAVFGITAKQFREQYPEAKGNQRDNASTVELIVLDYLSALNSHFILKGARQDARLEVLIEFARFAFETLSADSRFSLED